MNSFALKIMCPICEYKVDIPEPVKLGVRITCPNCFSQLGLFKHEDDYVLGCALCKEPFFNTDLCGSCERRRERRKLFKEGRLDF